MLAEKVHLPFHPRGFGWGWGFPAVYGSGCAQGSSPAGTIYPIMGGPIFLFSGCLGTFPLFLGFLWIFHAGMLVAVMVLSVTGAACNTVAEPQLWTPLAVCRRLGSGVVAQDSLLYT